MTTQLIVSFSALSITLLGGVLFFRNSVKLQPIFNLLSLIVISSILQNGLSPEEKQIGATAIIAALAGFNLLAAMVFKDKTWRWTFPILSLGLLLILGNVDLMFGDYPINFTSIAILSLFVLGFSIGVISNLITLLLKGFFENYHQSSINKTAQMVLFGLFVIPATFLASWYGIFLLGVGYFIYTSYAQHKNDVLLISILLVSVVTIFQQKFGLDGLDLTIGKMMAGLIVGVGAVSLGTLAMKATNKLIQILLLTLAIICLITISQLNNIHPAYGGPETLIIAMVGIATHLIVLGKREVANLLAPASITLALFLPSTVELDEQQNSTETAQTNTIVEKVEPSGLDASHLKGNFTIDDASSQIDFKLGPKGGVTKGAIKNFKGTVNFTEDFSSSKFTVILETKNLTTFNSMRDESIMGDAYLKETTFPVMKYVSSKLVKKDDGYLLSGEFTLLGRKNQEEVFIKYLGEKDGKHQLIGKSAIDRTNYGMASSPQEGNIIDFTFTMELK